MNTDWYQKVTNFTPSGISNPFTDAVAAGTASAAAIAATTAFAPVGAVGAGWAVVYAVATGTLTLEAANETIERIRNLNKEKQKEFDREVERLKKVKEEGAITEDEFDARLQDLLDRFGDNVTV